MNRDANRIFGVIGDPIDHSLSPRMHNAAFAHVGLPCLYLPFHVTSRELKNFVRHMGRMGLSGINVTIPHKISILDWLDSLSDDARRIGAVNTVSIENGRRRGSNTDGAGFLHALKSRTGFDPRGASVLLFGAGGSARAIAFALVKAGIKKISIVNRSMNHAESLATALKQYRSDVHCTIHGLASVRWQSVVPETKLIIQATSIGLKNNRSIPLRFSAAARGTVVCDIVYRPGLTPFLKKAAGCGLKILDGLPMLLSQGALAFRIWTGRRAPIDVMETILKLGVK